MNGQGFIPQSFEAEARRIRAVVLAVVVYLLALCLTFGHAAANAPERRSEADSVVCAFASGLLWPLYWSWWAFEKPKAPPAQQVEAL